MPENSTQFSPENDARFRAVINQIPIGVAEIDLSGHFLLVNDYFCEMIGYSREELLKIRLDKLIYPDDISLYNEIFQKCVSQEEPLTFKKRLVRKDGSQIWVNSNISIIRDNTGKAQSIIETIVDVTASKLPPDSAGKTNVNHTAISTDENSNKIKVHQTSVIDSGETGEESLFENKTILSLSMKSSRMGAWVRDIEADKIWWSEELEEIFGLEKGQFSGTDKHFYGLIYENDLPEMKAEVQRATAEYRDYTIEFRFHHADGTIRWMEGRGQSVYNEAGKPVKIYGIGMDITERKLHEINMSRLAAIVESSEDAIISKNLQGIVTSWNKGAEKLFGYTAEEITGKSITLLIPPRLINEEKEIIGKIRKGEKIEHYETVRQRKDGTEIIISLTVSPVYDKVGNIVGASKIAHDITEQKQTQQALINAERRASEEYLTLLARIVPLAQTLGTARELRSIYRVVHDFVRVSMPCTAFFVSFFNAEKKLRTAAYVWGEEGGEVDISILPPIPLTEDGGPNSQAVFQKKSVVVNHYMDAVKNHPHVVLQDNGINPNSSLVVPMIFRNRILGTLEVQAYQNQAFTNEHIIALEMVANLAAAAIENVRLSQAEADARENAEAANRAKDEFLSVLSHELRTPLNSILGWIRMMRTGKLNEAQINQAVEIIERNTILQNNLIEDLLDVSRIITGKLRIETKEIDFVPVVRTAAETIAALAESKNIFFDFQSDISAVKIKGDPTRLQQIVINLVNNAVKFTPEGGTVILRLYLQNKAAVLDITDTGIGINPDLLNNIFERFMQADSTTKRAHSGLGLGLTIVKHLTELHGGTVKAFSEGENKGALFRVEIPFIQSFEPDYFADESAVPKIDLSLQDVRILMVDDDCEGLIPLKMLLEQYSATVVCVDSARTALEKLSAPEDFDLIISDIGMPEIDGYDLIKKIRQTDRYTLTPAIALTAYASAEDRQRTLTAGFQHHLAKPLDFDRLLQIIKHLLNHSDNGKN